jgi:hypothetical protein
MLQSLLIKQKTPMIDETTPTTPVVEPEQEEIIPIVAPTTPEGETPEETKAREEAAMAAAEASATPETTTAPEAM